MNSALVSALNSFIKVHLYLHQTALSTVHSNLHEIAILSAELDWSRLPSNTRYGGKDIRRDRSDGKTMKKT